MKHQNEGRATEHIFVNLKHDVFIYGPYFATVCRKMELSGS